MLAQHLVDGGQGLGAGALGQAAARDAGQRDRDQLGHEPLAPERQSRRIRRVGLIVAVQVVQRVAKRQQRQRLILRGVAGLGEGQRLAGGFQREFGFAGAASGPGLRTCGVK